MVINLFLLSLHVPVAQKNKFIKYIAFRETLYKDLFNHITGTVDIGKANISSLIGLLNIIEDAGIKHQRIRVK